MKKISPFLLFICYMVSNVHSQDIRNKIDTTDFYRKSGSEIVKLQQVLNWDIKGTTLTHTIIDIDTVGILFRNGGKWSLFNERQQIVETGNFYPGGFFHRIRWLFHKNKIVFKEGEWEYYENGILKKKEIYNKGKRILPKDTSMQEYGW